MLCAALLALGLLIRAALYFPLAAFQIDSDAVLSGLCGFRIAEGYYPVFFPGGTRLSAASCYVAAGLFHLLGPGRVGLALTGLTWGALYLIFSLLFLRAILGRAAACLAFLFAVVPSEQFMTVTYAPWAYGEIVASCAATLWLAVLWRNEGRVWQRLAFGVSAGLGVWFSLESLMITIPAMVWTAIGRRRAMRREMGYALAGFLVGAAPFLAWNARNGYASLTQNWASKPAASLTQVWNNLAWFSTYLLPKLLFRSSGWWSETTLLMAAYAVVALGFAAAIRSHALRRADRYTPREIGALLALVFAACALIFSCSEAGSTRGWTVRYIAPLYVVVPLFLALGIATLWRWNRALGIITVAALLIPNLWLYGLPGSSLRAKLTSELSEDARIRTILARNDVKLLYGEYFWVYHFNFDTLEGVAAVPSAPVVDYFDYASRLGTMRVRWALLGGLDEVRRLAARVHARGSFVADGQLWLFIAERPTPNAASLIRALRRGG